MKRILLLAMLLAGCGLFTEEVSAQAVLGRHAITSGFHAGADGSVDLDGTIGQSFTGTASIPGQYLTQGFQQPDNNTPCPGDVNGDGLADLVAFARDGVYVYESTGGNQFRHKPTKWITYFGTHAGGWTTFDAHPRFVVDVNGDGTSFKPAPCPPSC